MRNIINKSVFKRLPKGASMEMTLAIYFHRLSATLYFIYSVWAVIAIFGGIPSLVQANGEQWQVIFSMAALVCTAPATFGATFWPSFARLEMFSGVAFAMLMALYVLVLLRSALFEGGPWAAVVIISSVGVMPICRDVIVVKFLLDQVEDRKRRAAAAADQGE